MYISLELKDSFLIMLQVSVLTPAAMQHFAFKKTRMISSAFISFVYTVSYFSRPAVGIIFLILLTHYPLRHIVELQHSLQDVLLKKNLKIEISFNISDIKRYKDNPQMIN